MFVKAFIFGGLICVIGQLLIDYTKLTPARILTSFVVAGVLLSNFGLYEHFAEFAGCGATVPISGFGHLLAKGVDKSLKAEGLLGVFKGPLTSAAAGIGAAIVFGFIMSVIFKPKAKK